MKSVVAEHKTEMSASGLRAVPDLPVIGMNKSKLILCK